MDDDRVGSTVSGYRVLEAIGRGGMGVVYLAEQASPRRKVALKLLSRDLASDPTFRERFIRESDAAASIEHPNIIPIHRPPRGAAAEGDRAPAGASRGHRPGGCGGHGEASRGALRKRG